MELRLKKKLKIEISVSKNMRAKTYLPYLEVSNSVCYYSQPYRPEIRGPDMDSFEMRSEALDLRPEKYTNVDSNCPLNSIMYEKFLKYPFSKWSLLTMIFSKSETTGRKKRKQENSSC